MKIQTVDAREVTGVRALLTLARWIGAALLMLAGAWLVAVLVCSF